MFPIFSYGVRVTTEECSVAVLVMSCQCIVGVIIQVVKSIIYKSFREGFIIFSSAKVWSKFRLFETRFRFLDSSEFFKGCQVVKKVGVSVSKYTITIYNIYTL